MMAGTVRGAFLCTREALPAMIRRKWGRIVNISSMWGQVGASCEVDYSAAKAAIIGNDEGAGKRGGPQRHYRQRRRTRRSGHGNAGLFFAGRKRGAGAGNPLERLGTPLDIAKAVCFLCSEDAAFITGQVLGVNGGL